MAESQQFALNSPVAPVRVLVRETDGQSPQFVVDWWSASGRCWCLCPMTADSSSVPSQDGFWFDDQKRSVPTGTCHRGVEERKDRPIGIGEPWSADLTLENQDLVAEGEDFGVAGEVGGEEPSEPDENYAYQSGKECHERGTLPTSPLPETHGITGRMNIRHPHGWGMSPLVQSHAEGVHGRARVP